MATQFVRNIGGNLDSLIGRAEIEIRNELKKKLDEQKNKLPTPKDLLEELGIIPNSESCSEKGMDKFEEKYNKIRDKLTSIEDKLKNVQIKMSQTEENLSKIITGEEGPVGQVLELKNNIIEPTILPVLQGIVIAIPIALLALPTPPPGFPGQQEFVRKLTLKLARAYSKVKELTELVAMISFMISFYQQKATRVLDPLKLLLSKLNFIVEEIAKFKAFLHSLFLQFTGECDALQNAANNSTGNSDNSIIPDPTGPTPLQEYLDLLKDQYEDVYNVLLESNNRKAIERIFAIKENLEEDYNISFKVINP
tara:strand:+ start:3585 stop:4511 length:927 start_codon:yes stop_codon:yes gene_type:complete